MAGFRRRTRFPGIPEAATKELVGLQDDVNAELRVLRGEAIGATTDTKSTGYSARYNERIRVLFPAAGGQIVFPAADPSSQNKWIEVLKIGGGNVTIVPTRLQVQGAASLVLTTNGFYYFQSDGQTSWWIQPTGGGGGLSPPVALTDLQTINDQRMLGNVSGGPATPGELTQAQVRTFVGVFGSGNAGLVPASGGGTVNFLRADGTFAAPGGGGLSQDQILNLMAFRA